jgi:hypothetical protein
MNTDKTQVQFPIIHLCKSVPHLWLKLFFSAPGSGHTKSVAKKQSIKEAEKTKKKSNAHKEKTNAEPQSTRRINAEERRAGALGKQGHRAHFALGKETANIQSTSSGGEFRRSEGATVGARMFEDHQSDVARHRASRAFSMAVKLLAWAIILVRAIYDGTRSGRRDRFHCGMGRRQVRTC